MLNLLLPRNPVLGQEAHCFPEDLHGQEPRCKSEKDSLKNGSALKTLSDCKGDCAKQPVT